jgi:rare lipoprotein A
LRPETQRSNGALKRFELFSVVLAATFFFLVGVGGAAIGKEELRDQSGIASTYSAKDKKTTNGEESSAEAMTAAHRSLPFGTRVRVTNSQNGHSVVVRITDRGPFASGRVIDVSPAAAHALGFIGLTQVNLSVIGGAGQ